MHSRVIAQHPFKNLLQLGAIELFQFLIGFASLLYTKCLAAGFGVFEALLALSDFPDAFYRNAQMPVHGYILVNQFSNCEKIDVV